MNKTLRKVIKLGSSKAITLPADYLPEASYVWVIRDPDAVRVVPAEVR